MVKCPYCQHQMMEGALFCEECGLSLWGDAQGEVKTKNLEEESNEFSVKSGWGTATFQDYNQVIIHIRESAEPITIKPSTEYLIGRQDSASGIGCWSTDRPIAVGAMRVISRSWTSVEGAAVTSARSA